MFLVMSGLRSDNEGANLVKVSKQARACMTQSLCCHEQSDADTE
jgi:hypothetical protein